MTTLDCPSFDAISCFRQIIRHHIGLIVPENEQPILSHILRERAALLQMNSPQTYLTFLESAVQENDLEWKFLANRLRVGESYFFRDSGQMSLLETSILPELLQRNADKHTLNILSAGCSTGEETYSVAMLLNQILPNWDNWNIKILGIDIDEQALDTARKGLYSKWSFRRVSKTIKNTYFEKQGANWRVNPFILSKVKFSHFNLVKHNFSENIDFMEMDLIICRNVFIYFHQNTIEMLIDKFVNILNADGYFLTGHGELYGINHPMLIARIFATSVIYQKLQIKQELQAIIRETLIPLQRHNFKKIITKNITSRNKFKKKIIVQNLRNNLTNTITNIQISLLPEVKEKQISDIVNELQAMFLDNQYDQMLAIDTNLIMQSPQALIGWKLLAQAYANLDKYEQAKNCCNEMLKIDIFYAPAYFILASVTLEQGEELKRIELLKKSLYLDNNFVAPMLELAEIAAEDGKHRKAKKLREAAYKILNALPEDSRVDMLESWTVQNLLNQVQAMINE